MRGLWPGGGAPFVVCTGGEPLLQLDEGLIEALRSAGFEVAVETNGTREARNPGLDLRQSPGRDDIETGERPGLKLVYPQEGLDPRTSRIWIFGISFFSPWTPRTGVGDTRRDRILPRSSPLADFIANPQTDGD